MAIESEYEKRKRELRAAGMSKYHGVTVPNIPGMDASVGAVNVNVPQIGGPNMNAPLIGSTPEQQAGLDATTTRYEQTFGKPRDITGSRTPKTDIKYNAATKRAAELNLAKDDPLTHYYVKNGKVVRRRISERDFQRTGKYFGSTGKVTGFGNWGGVERSGWMRKAYGRPSHLDLAKARTSGDIRAVKTAHDQQQAAGHRQNAMKMIMSGMKTSDPKVAKALEQAVMSGDNKAPVDILKMEMQIEQANQMRKMLGPIDQQTTAMLEVGVDRNSAMTGKDYSLDKSMIPRLRGADVERFRKWTNDRFEKDMAEKESKREIEEKKAEGKKKERDALLARNKAFREDIRKKSVAGWKQVGQAKAGKEAAQKEAQQKAEQKHIGSLDPLKPIAPQLPTDPLQRGQLLTGSGLSKFMSTTGATMGGQQEPQDLTEINSVLKDFEKELANARNEGGDPMGSQQFKRTLYQLGRALGLSSDRVSSMKWEEIYETASSLKRSQTPFQGMGGGGGSADQMLQDMGR